MDKIDYRKVYKEAYQPSAREPRLIDVPAMHLLMIDGRGDPNGSEQFQQCVELLFGLSYTLKFMVKKGPLGIDYAVMPLEGLWWSDDMSRFMEDRSAWQWTLMIMQPPVVNEEMVEQAKAALRQKRGDELGNEVRWAHFDEGKAAQIMHLGPYSEEGPTVERLHRFIAEQGYRLAGKHHEIYLSDMRRSDPAKWKTVLRQPVTR